MPRATSAALARRHDPRDEAPSPLPEFDSWRRAAPIAQLPPLRAQWLEKLLDARGRAHASMGGLSAEERMLGAILELGPTTPLLELASAAGVSSTWAVADSVRKRGRHVRDRLVARGVVRVYHERRPFRDCTHVQTKGTAGRLECQRAREARGFGETCVAHHGWDVCELVFPPPPGSVAAYVALLDLSEEEITARVEKAKLERAEARQLAGRQGNDAEGRKWKGLPTTRGPRGTNHTSPRYAGRKRPAHFPPLPPLASEVPPIPPEGLEGIETSASSGGERGDCVARDEAPPAPCLVSTIGTPAAHASLAPAAGSTAAPGASPTLKPPEPLGGDKLESERGERIVPPESSRQSGTIATPTHERAVPTLTTNGLSSPLDLAGGGAAGGAAALKPGNVVDLAERREVAKRRDWLLARWRACGLPELNAGADRKAAWVRAATYTTGDLELGIRRAVIVHRDRSSQYRSDPWRFVFANPTQCAQIIDVEREKAPMQGMEYRAAPEERAAPIDARYAEIQKLEAFAAKIAAEEAAAKSETRAELREKIAALEGKLGANVQRTVRTDQQSKRRKTRREEDS